jgi:Protein of unknown function with PCYCGC motif
MQAIKKVFGGVVLLFVAVGLIAVPQPASSRSPQSGSDEVVPAFHPQPPKDALPLTMDPKSFSQPIVVNAYAVAARVKRVLYQEPCYCHCDRSQGHGSLLDCFVSKHGSGCDICIDEDLYAYEQTCKGKTPAQIREGIIKGEWQSVDTSKYASPLSFK